MKGDSLATLDVSEQVNNLFYCYIYWCSVILYAVAMKTKHIKVGACHFKKESLESYQNFKLISNFSKMRSVFPNYVFVSYDYAMTIKLSRGLIYQKWMCPQSHMILESDGLVRSPDKEKQFISLLQSLWSQKFECW